MNPTDRLAYYTLSTGGPDAAMATQQMVRSVASLRAYNRTFPVRVFVCGALDGEARRALLAHEVVIDDMGDYEAHLAALCPPRMGEVLSRYPVLHKFTCLPRLGAEGPARLLRLDGDTVFFHDVELLFERYAELDLYAREEPSSRACPFGYRPELCDEDALSALAGRVGSRAVAPFNSGIMLWNHGAWRALGERIEELLRYVFRFSLWLADRTETPKHADLVHLRVYRNDLVTPADEAEALPYPSRNAWIRDQVALWLTVGKIGDLRIGTMASCDLLQGLEFSRVEPGRHVLAHYFSENEERFTAWLDDQEGRRDRSAGAAPEEVKPTAASTVRGSSMQVFEELGARLDAAWELQNYDESAFSALAAPMLREAELHRAITGRDVIDWVLMAREIPSQDDIEARFGQPPITVYHGRRFYIQVLLWTEGMTAIHRHAFSGAFLVLEGSSLHVTYEFSTRRRVSSRLLVGDLRHKASSLHAPGSVVPIDHDLIHATFHLETPSATVVVRSYRDEEVAIQYEYLPPSVACDPFFEDPATKRRLQALRFLRITKQRGHVERAAELVARSDLHTAWVVLLAAYRALGSAARAAPILEAARLRHGEVISDLAAALDEELRRRKLHQVREVVRDPSERFFLALLQNLPDRRTIEAMIQQRYPGVTPRARVVAWLEALSGAGVIGVDFGDRLTREIVLAMLDGCNAEGVKERLKTLFDPGEIDAASAAITRQCGRIRRTTLGPLFVE